MKNERFLKACRKEPVDCTPVWFMRQAGRYMPEYRALRLQHSILDICPTAELAAAVTLPRARPARAAAPRRDRAPAEPEFARARRGDHLQRHPAPVGADGDPRRVREE